MTINIDNKTWTRNPSQVSGGRFYSDVDKVPASGAWSITGSGFGTAPTLTHSAVALASLTNGQQVPASPLSGFSSETSGARLAVIVTATGARKTGGLAIYGENDGDNNGAANSLMLFDLGSQLSAGEKLLVSYWIKLKPYAPGIGDGQHKWLRISNTDNITDHVGEIRFFNWRVTTEGQQIQSVSTATSVTASKTSGVDDDTERWMQWDDTWRRVDVLVQESTLDAFDGYVGVVGHFADGSAVPSLYEMTTFTSGATMPNAVKTASISGDYKRFIIFQNFFGNGTTNALKDYGGEVWMDDVVIQRGAWKRVELTNAATLAASTVREIQPFTTWTDTEITGDQIVSAYTGTRYLHVIDESGNSVASVQIDIPDDSVSFTGSGFGTGPTIEIFDRMERGTDGQVLPLTGADIGSWTSYSNTVYGSQNTAYCMVENGRKWMANRHLSYLHEAAARTCGFEKQISAKSTDFYFSYRWKVADGRKFPGSLNDNEISNNSSNFKVSWFWDSDEGDLAGDVCIPSFTSSSGCVVSGNAFKPAGTGGDYGFEPNRAKFSGSAPNFFSWYQIAGTDGAYNGKAGIRSVSSLGYHNEDRTDVDVFKVNAWSGNKDGYNRFCFGGWMGNAPSDSLADVLVLFTDCYLAIGANNRARIVMHNAATIASSTEIYDIPPASWTTSAVTSVPLAAWERLPYASLILGDGTVAQTKSTGW